MNVMNIPDIKVITGVRRSGKSKLLEAFMAHALDTDPSASIIHIDFNLNAPEHLTNSQKWTGAAVIAFIKLFR